METSISKAAGLAPGTLVHIGEQFGETVKITLYSYDCHSFQKKEAKTIEEAFPDDNSPFISWINIDGIHQAHVLEKIGQRFDIHPLVLEDTMNTGQRPKTETFEKYIFTVLKMLYSDNDETVKIEQVSMIFTDRVLITLQEEPGDVFDPVRTRIENSRGTICRLKADYLAYSLIDSIVDNYFVLLENLGEKIEDLEEDLVDAPTPDVLQRIYKMRREMIRIRRSVWPLRETIGALQRSDSPIIGEQTRLYLRDLYDHTVQVIESVETYREMLSGMLDIYLSSTSNRMNEIMKVLTIIATIFIPLTFIAGVYGMNFKFMPELEWKWGYLGVLIFMGVVAGIEIYFFRKKNWL